MFKWQKKSVVDGWLVSGLPVQIRYPREHFMLGYGDDPRVGMHDDCILAQGEGGPDSGTFDKPSCKWGNTTCLQTGWDWNQWNISQAWTLSHVKGIMGGESCSDAGNVPDCAPLLKFFTSYRVSYYNSDWPDTIHKLFIDKGECYNNVKALLESNTPAFVME